MVLAPIAKTSLSSVVSSSVLNARLVQFAIPSRRSEPKMQFEQATRRLPWRMTRWPSSPVGLKKYAVASSPSSPLYLERDDDADNQVEFPQCESPSNHLHWKRREIESVVETPEKKCIDLEDQKSISLATIRACVRSPSLSSVVSNEVGMEMTLMKTSVYEELDEFRRNGEEKVKMFPEYLSEKERMLVKHVADSLRLGCQIGERTIAVFKTGPCDSGHALLGRPNNRALAADSGHGEDVYVDVPALAQHGKDGFISRLRLQRLSSGGGLCRNMLWDVAQLSSADGIADPVSEGVDATTDAGKKLKELTDAVTPHVQKLFDTYPNLEKVVVPLGGTLCGTMMAWLVMPIILRRLHKYASQSPIAALLGNLTKNDVSYQTSLWCALEDPTKYLITFMAFSEMATLIAPSISTYLTQAWRGAFVLSFVWFLQRWKTNFITKAMTNPDASSLDRDKISAFDKVSSLGLIGLGVMGLAEACGVAVQSILTVGGVGGVATAFAARDVLGNILSGFSLQFSKPFSVNDYIKAGPIEGRVVEIGLTSTSLINPEKLPVIVPNSLFSSQMIVNRSRANWRASVTKIPIRIEDIEKVPSVSEEIKVMLRSNPNVSFDSDVPYCYLSRLESSYGELTIGCNLKNMRKDEWLSTEQDILLGAARIIKSHGIELGSTMQCC